MNKKQYIQMLNYINNHKRIKDSLIIISKLSPIFIIISYILLLIESLIIQQSLIKITMVPFITLVIITIIRSTINKPRPFEEFECDPLIPHSLGKSFPSRHTASACIITMTFLYLKHSYFLIVLLLAICVAITRVLSGVHRISDVLSAILLSCVCGLFGFYII